MQEPATSLILYPRGEGVRGMLFWLARTDAILFGEIFNSQPVPDIGKCGRREWVVTGLAHYRCYFLDALMALVGSEEFHSDDDNGAVERVISLFHERNYHHLGFELWHGGRLVHRHPPATHGG